MNKLTVIAGLALLLWTATALFSTVKAQSDGDIPEWVTNPRAGNADTLFAVGSANGRSVQLINAKVRMEAQSSMHRKLNAPIRALNSLEPAFLSGKVAAINELPQMRVSRSYVSDHSNSFQKHAYLEVMMMTRQALQIIDDHLKGELDDEAYEEYRNSGFPDKVLSLLLLEQ